MGKSTLSQRLQKLAEDDASSSGSEANVASDHEFSGVSDIDANELHEDIADTDSDDDEQIPSAATDSVSDSGTAPQDESEEEDEHLKKLQAEFDASQASKAPQASDDTASTPAAAAAPSLAQDKPRQVHNQYVMLADILAIRHEFQALIHNVNELPVPELAERLAEETSSSDDSSSDVEDNDDTSPAVLTKKRKVADVQAEATDALNELCQSIVDLQTKLRGPRHLDIFTAVDKTSDPADDAGQDWETLLEARRAPLTTYRRNTLEKWSEKIRMCQGTTTAQANLKVASLTENAQIDRLLQDPDRLIKRTFVERADYTFLASDQLPTTQVPERELFDDLDFYQQILNEMVQQQNQEEHLFGGLATAGTALGGQGAVAAIKLHNLKMLQRQQRKKKKVDTKASKGRKIRYQVQEKLVGFMAPEPKGEWTTERMDEFFASLLIETGTEADTVDASAPAPAQVMEDGFKLF